jgi:flagellar motor switch protein FliN
MANTASTDTQTNEQVTDNNGNPEVMDGPSHIGGAITSTLFKPLSGAGKADTANDIDMILDIPVTLTVELGQTKLPIKNLLQLSRGSVIELNGMAGDPLDILVNGCLIAQGEVVVVNERFGIRLTDIITPSERIRKLNK